MFVILWEFEVKPGCTSSFVSQYGPAGPWIALFQRDSAYRETRLLQDPFRPEIYVTLDFWSSRAAYEQFQTAHRDEYLAIDAACEALTLREEKLGEFETTT